MNSLQFLSAWEELAHTRFMLEKIAGGSPKRAQDK